MAPGPWWYQISFSILKFHFIYKLDIILCGLTRFELNFLCNLLIHYISMTCVGLLSGVWLRNTEHSTGQRCDQRLWLLLPVSAALSGSCGHVCISLTHTLKCTNILYNLKGILSRICLLLFVNTPFKVGSSSPAQQSRERTNHASERVNESHRCWETQWQQYNLVAMFLSSSHLCMK